jgi:5-methylcytosine-specific restriction endonuclease McrBC GTP-binding regulatory subunit McrB
MNTADRSVEALDAALRRRFSFVEMQPRPELIATDGKLKDKKGVIGTIDLPLLLGTINKRLEKLLDKDHLIGHSYFMNVTCLDELKVVFQNKIIPLLQEYFFGDYGKIGLVLGKDFFVSPEVQSKNLFADFGDYDDSDFSERKIYKIKSVSGMSEDDFNIAINTLLRK